MPKKEIKEKIEDWEKEFDEIWGQRLKNTPLAREVRFFIRQLFAQEKQKWVEEIDKVYIKEKGIHNWLDLREKLLTQTIKKSANK